MPGSAAGRTNRFLQAKLLRLAAAPPIGGFGAPRHQSDVLGRDTGPFRSVGLAMPRAPNAEMHNTRRRRAKQPTLREHLADGVDRRPDLAQHLQDARGIVPPLQRVLELPEVKHHIPQIVGRRLLAWSTN